MSIEFGKKYKAESIQPVAAAGYHSIEYVTPVFKSKYSDNILVVFSYPSGTKTSESTMWVTEQQMSNAVEYKEIILDICHEGQCFKLDLNKARKLGLIV